ncbi:MAG: serine/threonine-protein kinase [Blastocatellia bacterium]
MTSPDEKEVSLPTDRQARLTIGQQIGRYEIQRLLAVGGMGEVYLARDMRLARRRVALKILLPQFDEQKLQRFEQEARAAASLNHGNIATVYDAGEADGYHFIATEFIEGETLDGYRSTKGRMPPQQAIVVAIQMAEALEAAHKEGIVHRDIKPGNVMLLQDGKVKVVDFGIAKLNQPQAHPAIKTEPGMTVGTPSYMSPEQVRGLEIDSRTDIFSFGIVIYELVTDRRLFIGTYAEIFAAILNTEATSIFQYAPEAPDELQEIIERTLRKDRDERYQNFGEVLVDLRELKRRQETRTEPALPLPEDPNGEAKRSLKAWLVAIAMLVSLALIAVSIWIFRLPSRLVPAAPSLQELSANANESTPKTSLPSNKRELLPPIERSRAELTSETRAANRQSSGSSDRDARNNKAGFMKLLNYAERLNVEESEPAHSACQKYQQAYKALPYEYEKIVDKNLIRNANYNFLDGKYIIAARQFRRAFRNIRTP